MKNIHVVAALIRRGDQILATQRGYGPLKGGWEFPGGKIKDGETPQEALMREIQEELDLEIAVGRLYERVEYDYPEFHLTMDCYWCSIVSGEITLKEHLLARWLKPDELRTVDWLPADTLLIDRLEKEGYTIKNLVFDVGNVLFSYRWNEMLMDHGLSEAESKRVGEEIFGAEMWAEKFDRGIYGPSRLVEEYGKLYPKDKEDIQWFLDNADQMHIRREEVWRLVRILKQQGYRIYLLSNYSEYLFKIHTKDAPFMEDLDGQVVSYEPHFIKPEREIYQYLMDKYHLKPEECLFFDDRLENVEASHAFGMDAICVTSQRLLEGVLGGLCEEE